MIGFKNISALIALLFIASLQASKPLELKQKHEAIDHLKMDRELEAAYKKADTETRKRMIDCLSFHGCTTTSYTRFEGTWHHYDKLNFDGLSKGIICMAEACTSSRSYCDNGFYSFSTNRGSLDVIALFGNDQLTRHVYECCWQKFHNDPEFLRYVINKPYCHLDADGKRRIAQEKKLFSHIYPFNSWVWRKIEYSESNGGLDYFENLGVDIHAPINENGDTQLMHTIDALADFDSVVENKDKANGEKFLANQCKKVESLIASIAKRADRTVCVNQHNAQGDTALTKAAALIVSKKRTEFLIIPYLLLEAGAEPEIQNGKGESFISMQTRQLGLESCWVKFRSDAQKRLQEANTSVFPSVLMIVTDYLYTSPRTNSKDQ